MKKKLIIGIAGASGSIYAKHLLQKLNTEKIRQQIQNIAVVLSNNAIDIWKSELDENPIEKIKHKIYENKDFSAPFASGSAIYDLMVICPCSVGVLGRIANGISNDLLTRSADVILKEQKKLILVIRETPLNLIHLQNMQTISSAGGIICPANPSFYLKPRTVEDLVENFINRILKLSGFDFEMKSWENNIFSKLS